MFELIVKIGGREIDRLSSTHAITVIGRNPSADLVIENISVSGRHAAIRQVGPKYILTDLGSTNGTFLNQTPVKNVELHDGDTVQLGKVAVEFHLPAHA